MQLPAKPWTPAEATDRIRAMAARDDLDVYLTFHAKEQMQVRDILMGDLLHLLKTGFVYEEAQPATREGFYKYLIEGGVPSGEGRAAKSSIIPHESAVGIKIVTVMWKDEK